MSGNPFNDHLDWAVKGKEVRVHTSHRVYEGWAEILHHQRGSIILHDAVVKRRIDAGLSEGEDVGSVFIRTPEQVEVIRPKKRIEQVELAFIVDSPFYDADFEATDHHTRMAYRNQYTGGFPVARIIHRENEPEHYELINGHKRVAAARRAGMDAHPVEVIDVDDATAKELVALAHSEEETTGDPHSTPLEEFTDGDNEEDD